MTEKRHDVAASGEPANAAPERLAWEGAPMPRSAVLASPADELNKAIIKKLQEDGRAPYAEIAAALGVSEGTVRNRVMWMKQSGMLRIVAVADPTGLNYKSDAMLGIKVVPSMKPEEVARRLAVQPEVVYILWVSGRFDLLVEIVSDSEEDFVRFVNDHCFGQQDIASTEIMMGLAMYKNQFLLKRDFP